MVISFSVVQVFDTLTGTLNNTQKDIQFIISAMIWLHANKPNDKSFYYLYIEHITCLVNEFYSQRMICAKVEWHVLKVNN